MGQAALSLATMGLALPLFAAVPAQAQAPRTWVSGAGSDANPCSRTAPCRTFDGALQGGKTAAGGEINCLDASDFGPVNITTSLTISCEAGTAGILAPNSIIAVGINAVSSSIETAGHGERLLCAVFAFDDVQKRRIYFIYNYKRGFWYPFVPDPSGAQQRLTERELQLKAQMGAELPMEPELERWFPLWGIPI